MSFKKTFWINTTDKELATSYTSNSTARQPAFSQGDEVPIECILLEKTGNDGLPFRNISISSETLKVALGRADQPATSGTYTLDFDGDSTTALSYDIASTDLETALNLLPSIVLAGGVTVSGSDGGPFTVAFNNDGARNYITADLSLLEPASVLNVIRKQVGDGSTKEIQVLRIAEGVFALQSSFSAIPSPTASITTLIAGGSGINEVQQLQIDRPCVGGLISLTFGGETTSFNYGSSATVVKTSLEGNSNIGSGNISVTKVSDSIYTFEFTGTLAGSDQAEMTVDDSALDGFVGFSGSLDLDNYSVESFLAGASSRDCLLEFELTDGSNKSTLATVSANITNDIINNATTSPPLTPSILFVESVNGESGTLTGYYKSGGTDVAIADGGTGASSASAARTNLGLGNVDNTSDADKPVSTAQQTALDLKADNTTVTEIDTNVDDLITLSGVPENSSDLGTFTGDIITDNSTVKTAIQELETELENAGSGNFPASSDRTAITSAHTVVAGDINENLPIGSGTTADFDITLDVSLFSSTNDILTIVNESDYIVRVVVSNTGTMSINSQYTDRYVSAGQTVTFAGDTSTNCRIVAGV